MAEEDSVLDPMQVFIEVALMFIGFLTVLISAWNWWPLGVVAGASLVASAWLYERVCRLEAEVES